MQIREYQKPATLDEAYALLVKGKTNRILGGCTFLKRTNVKIGTAIDLSACGLDYIRETEEAVMIGDRRYDIEGAAETGLASIAVGWGYAAPGELEAARPDRFAPDIETLRRLLIGQPSGAVYDS